MDFWQVAEVAIKGATLLILIGTTVVNVILFMRRRNDKRAKAIEDRQDKLDEKVAQHGVKLGAEVADRKEESALIKQRLALAEQAIKVMPTHGDYMKIIDRLSNVERDVASIDTKTDGMQETLNTIRDHLLDRRI
ncbi:MAG: hypothetical protein JNM58_00740 [Xanthomonadaceae bacterium]|nr:hypothetical protein [Xanthomonadaceae bacterium]